MSSSKSDMVKRYAKRFLKYDVYWLQAAMLKLRICRAGSNLNSAGCVDTAKYGTSCVCADFEAERFFD